MNRQTTRVEGRSRPFLLMGFDFFSLFSIEPSDHDYDERLGNEAVRVD